MRETLASSTQSEEALLSSPMAISCPLSMTGSLLLSLRRHILRITVDKSRITASARLTDQAIKKDPCVSKFPAVHGEDIGYFKPYPLDSVVHRYWDIDKASKQVRCFRRNCSWPMRPHASSVVGLRYLPSMHWIFESNRRFLPA
jgi:hypothetical protein